MKPAFLILMMAAVGMAQTPQTSSVRIGAKSASQKPLQCGQYEQVDHWPGSCGPAPCDETGCYAVCLPPPPDKCVPIMHSVTEKEWVELMQRLEALEKQANGTPIFTLQSSARWLTQDDIKKPPPDYADFWGFKGSCPQGWHSSDIMTGLPTGYVSCTRDGK